MRKIGLMFMLFVIFPFWFCQDVSAYDECSYYDHTVPCTLPGNTSIILDSVMGNAAGWVGYFVGACYEETDWYDGNGNLYADLHALENPIPEGCAFYHVSKSYLWFSSTSVFGGFGGANFLKDSGFFWISAASDHFTWPIAPQNSSDGHYGACGEWPGDSQGCYWLSDISTDQSTVWRDVQPFQMHYWKYKNISGRHLGADYNIKSGDLDRGEFVYSVGKGVISKVDKQPSWGNIIYIRHDTSFGTYTSMYAHVDFLESGAPAENTPVELGTPIARVGNGTWENCRNNKCRTVQGTWPAHLHFEIRERDSTYQGLGYTRCRDASDTSASCIVARGPEGQIDPNAFISTHR